MTAINHNLHGPFGHVLGQSLFNPYHEDAFLQENQPSASPEPTKNNKKKKKNVKTPVSTLRYKYKFLMPDFVSSGLVHHFKNAKVRAIGTASRCKVKFFLHPAITSGLFMADFGSGAANQLTYDQIKTLNNLIPVECDYAVLAVSSNRIDMIHTAINMAEALIVRFLKDGKYTPSYAPLLEPLIRRYCEVKGRWAHCISEIDNLIGPVPVGKCDL